MTIKKGDTIFVITGKDKGKKGKIIQALPKEGKVVVENINLRKKHVKPRKSGEKGQIIEFPAKINASNVMFYCPKCSKSSRIGYTTEGGNKKRICKKCKKEV